MDTQKRIEIYDDDHISTVFMHLLSIEKKGITLGKIDETGLFTCDMDRIPLKWIRITPESLCYGYSKDLYIISTEPDILHSIRIYGRFKSATLYQYSFLDQRIEYDHVEGMGEEIDDNHVTIMNPFPYSGIPLLQIGKNIYLELIPEHDNSELPKCEIGYGYLDHAIRCDFNVKDNQVKGVSFLHKNGQRFAIFGVNTYGHNANVMKQDVHESITTPSVRKISQPTDLQSSDFVEYTPAENISCKNPLYRHNQEPVRKVV